MTDRPEIKELDFSIFHPLDHWPGPQCRQWYGGWRRHLKIAWELRWRGETICRLGWHDWADGRDSTGWSGKSCWFCWKHKN